MKMREVKQYESRTIFMAVLPKGEPLYSELATIVSIEDESGGEFVKVSQHLGVSEGPGSITICPEEWELLRGVINFMVAECRSDTPSEGETNEN